MSLGGYIGMAFGFCILVFVHELGHYLLAKWNGVRVHVFSIGMGPYIFSFTKGETLYVLSLVPLGGYVKLAGQDDLKPALDATADPKDYRNKSPWQRAQILAAGAFFNLIFAFIVFTICFMMGVDQLSTRMDEPDDDSPLTRAYLAVIPDKDLAATLRAKAREELDPKKRAEIERQADDAEKGIQRAPMHKGDRVLAINGDDVHSLMDLQLAVAVSGTSKDLLLTYERDEQGNGHYEKKPPVLVRPVADDEGKSGGAKIGMDAYRQEEKLRLGFSITENQVWVEGVVPGSPAQAAGFQAGDEIIELDGHKIDRQAKFIRIVSKGKDSEHEVKIKRGAEEKAIKIRPRYEPKDKSFRMGLMLTTFRVADVAADSEAAKLGLKPGGFVVEIDPEDPKTSHMFTYVEFGPDGKEEKRIPMEVPLTTQSTSKLEITKLKPDLIKLKADSFGSALGMGWRDLKAQSTAVFRVVKGLVSGDIGLQAISGPAGIAKGFGDVAQYRPFSFYLWFLAFVSVNLGVMQFIPIPLLDGWHLLMIGIEKLKGSPVSAKIQEYAMIAGGVMLLCLVLYATSNDIKRIFFH